MYFILNDSHGTTNRLQAYRDYVAIKLHFRKEIDFSFDRKYERLTEDSLNRRADSFYFRMFSETYEDRSLSLRFLVDAMMLKGSDFHISHFRHLELDEYHTLSEISRRSLYHIFSSECEQILDSSDSYGILESLKSREGFAYLAKFKKMNGNHLSDETLAIFHRVVNYFVPGDVYSHAHSRFLCIERYSKFFEDSGDVRYYRLFKHMGL